jgi:hypothetical protein
VVKRTVEKVNDLSDLGTNMALSFGDDETLQGGKRSAGRKKRKEGSEVETRAETNLQAIPRQPQRRQRSRVPPPDVRVILDQRADEERVRPGEPPLETALVLVDPLDSFPRFSFDERPSLGTDGDGGEAFGKLEGETHEGAGDEEADGDVEEVKEAW